MNSSFTIKKVSSMKKQVLVIAVAAIAAQTMSAQTVEESKLTDNWYIGINGGVNAKTSHTSIFNNLNPSAGLRIGRNITPVFGMAAEGEAYFDNKGSENRPLGTFVKGINVSLLGTTNFSNWFGGYPGSPRVFEVVGVYGLGWGHAFHTASVKNVDENKLTSKFGIDFTFNLGASRAWQIYVEPNITYGLNMGDKIQYNVNNSALGVLVGVNYKLGNSNGTHNFKTAELRDQAEIDAMNMMINDLRVENDAKDDAIRNGNRRISDLQSQLEAARNQKPTTTVVVNETNNVLQPSVIFRQGKSTIDAAQYASISMIATYMKNHKDANILIKGYASPEGNADFNQRLSEARANAVRDALVKRYKVSADRLTTQGMGTTDKLFDELDFNRVVTFIDTTK